MTQKRLSLSAIFKYSFALAKKHFIVVIGLILGYIILSLVLDALSSTAYSVINFIVGVVALVVSLLFILGLNRTLLDAIDGGEPSFDSFKRETGKVLPLFGQQLLRGSLQLLSALPVVVLFFVTFFSLASTEMGITIDELATYDETEVLEVFTICVSLIGVSTWVAMLALLLFPLYVTIRFMYAPFVLIDEEGSGAISSLRRSWAMTKGHVWVLFVLAILVGLLNILGVVALLVGVLFTVVISSFVGAVSYRMLQGSEQLQG